MVYAGHGHVHHAHHIYGISPSSSQWISQIHNVKQPPLVALDHEPTDTFVSAHINLR